MTTQSHRDPSLATPVADEYSAVAQADDTTGSAASNAVAVATDGAKDVAGQAAEETKAVVSQAKQQIDSLVSQTRDEVRHQAEDRSAQAASGLRTLSEQVAALADGRPENAGSLPRYLQDAEDEVRRLATRLEQRGPQGVMDDVAGFARRRPGLFLAGAVGAGFVTGRMLRASSGQNGSGSSGQNGPTSISTISAAAVPPPPVTPSDPSRFDDLSSTPLPPDYEPETRL